MDILKSLNQDFNAIQKIEDSLFDVVKIQLHPTCQTSSHHSLTACTERAEVSP
jgi:hypothetical protein